MCSDHLAPEIARCEPEQRWCAQANGCARCVDRPQGIAFTTVDASICLDAGYCPMFIDVRQLALPEAA